MDNRLDQAEAYCPLGHRLRLTFNARTGYEEVACDICNWAECDSGCHDSIEEFLADAVAEFPRPTPEQIAQERAEAERD